MKDRTKQLGTEDVGKLLFKLSMPAVIGMFVIALYNIVDTIFVGQGVGALAIGGLTVVFPIQMIVMAVAQTVGIGGSSIISRALGSNNPYKANLTFGNLFTLIVVMSLVLAPLAYIFIDELLLIFGAKGQIMIYAKEYFRIIVWGGPFFSVALMFSSVLRAEGNARISMNVMIIAAVVNLIFDPIFIFVLKLGVAGAGYATLLSQIFMAAYVIWFYITGRGELSLMRKNFQLNIAIVKETFAIGSSSLARQISGSVVAAVLNHSLIAYGGEIAMAAFGAINRVIMMMFMPMFGIVQGFLPIAGYNYGALKYDRLILSIKKAILSTSLISLAGFLWFLIFPRHTLAIFTTDKELLDIGENAMRMIIFAMPVVGFQVIGASLFQAIGKALPSLLLSLSRQVLFFLPLVFILPVWFGIDGIWLTFPIADFLAFMVTLILFIPQMRKFVHKSSEIKTQQ